MAVTIKVNGVANSLVHKGSGGISAATLPDVCKTPSPGGPVPLPYPNVSQSATLAKGTTTVKADGGQMIAIKGSEFSVSNGDNPGTLGGVKSSTFMKESTWISYSFDVKMDGKNACRLTDKKFQNHENTVDLAGEFQGAFALLQNPLEIDCADNPNLQKGDADDEACQKKQICAKAVALNGLAAKGKLKRYERKHAYKKARSRGNSYAETYRNQAQRALEAGAKSPADMAKSFAHPCAYDQWIDNGAQTDFRNPFYSPDHVHEIQLMGRPRSPRNIKWMSREANEFMGRSLKKFNPTQHDGIKPNCCD